MDKQMMMKFKTMFEAEKKKLTYSNLSVTDEAFHMSKDDMLDEVDFTSTELETSMRMRLRNREALFLKKIDEAIARIADGSFGVCASCSGDIELKRLEARPTATHCVDCKEEAERRETLHIDGHRHKSIGRRLRLA